MTPTSSELFIALVVLRKHIIDPIDRIEKSLQADNWVTNKVSDGPLG